MADTNLRIDVAAEFTGAKAFRQAETAAFSLEKSVKNLAKSLGIAFTAQAAVNFGKSSLKAFIADEEATNKLAVAVKNLGMEFANPYIADYIKNLEATSKVADDQLRPAFQSLLQQTGSLAKAQSILNTAIETSRGSGYDLATVSNDLAQAYVGNTKGLKKYYLGLDTATLKAKSFTDIQEIMNKQFSGSSAAYLATYSGQVGILSLAWQNFQEKVGGALLTMASFGEGSKGKGLSNLAKVLDHIGSAIDLISKGWNTVASLFNVMDLKNGLLSKFNPYQTGAVPKTAENTAKSLTKYEELLKQIEADRIKQNAAITKDKKQQLALDKAKAALAKASANFDITKINLAAALKGKVSEDEKNRLMALQAIENGNGEEALKWIAKIDDARAKAAADEEARQKALHDSIMARLAILNAAIQEKQAALLMLGMGGSAAAAVSSGNSSYIPNMGAGQADFGAAAYQVPTNPYGSSYYGATGRDPMPITVVLDSNVVGNAVRDVFLGDSLSGSQAAINRNVGTFSV